MNHDRSQLTLAHETAALLGDQPAADYYDAALKRLDVAERDAFDARLRDANEAAWRATQPDATDWERVKARLAWMRVMNGGVP